MMVRLTNCALKCHLHRGIVDEMSAITKAMLLGLEKAEYNQSSVKHKCLHMFWLQPISSLVSLVRACDKNTLRTHTLVKMALLEEPVPSHLFVCYHEICWLGHSDTQRREALIYVLLSIFILFTRCLCSAVCVFSCSKMEMSHWHMCKHSSPFFVFVTPGEKHGQTP